MRTQISEARRTTHDGRIWPISRGVMKSAKDIRDRMVEDISQLVDKDGEDAVVSGEDLSRKGWTSAQIEHHGKGAFDLFHARRGAKENVGTAARQVRRRDSGARMAAEAAALAAFIMPLLVITGHLSGKL